MRGWLVRTAVWTHVAIASGAGGVSVGCAGAGPYGYAQVYAPLDAEQAAVDGSVPYDPSAVRRRAKQWQGRTVNAFVIVERVQSLKGNPSQLDVVASLRTLQPRNLCQEPDESSCRVTVSDQSFDAVRVVLSQEVVWPKGGEHPDSIQPGSLLRVIGKVTPPAADADEVPRIDATLVRHWPLKTYVTASNRDIMRR